MREILFRGKRKDNGEWIKGSFWDEIPGELGGIAQYGSCCFRHVDLATVGQFTGLTDKNDKRIFEGDIIKNEYEKEKYQYFKIFYCEGTLCWCVKNKYGMTGKLCNVIGNMEVIGNIHDNPELLEG